MPIYAYRCLKCEAQPEYLQKMSEPPITVCEACGGELVRKVTAAAFHLKGGGWYKDGYASTKPGEGAADKGGESKPAGESASSTPAKSESSAPSDSSSKPSSSSPASSTAGAAA